MTTYHDNLIADLREESERLSAAIVIGWTPEEKAHRVLSIRAAADLLERHDAGSLDLLLMPELRVFVESTLEFSIGAYGAKVQPRSRRPASSHLHGMLAGRDLNPWDNLVDLDENDQRVTRTVGAPIKAGDKLEVREDGRVYPAEG